MYVCMYVCVYVIGYTPRARLLSDLATKCGMKMVHHWATKPEVCNQLVL